MLFKIITYLPVTFLVSIFFSLAQDGKENIAIIERFIIDTNFVKDYCFNDSLLSDTLKAYKGRYPEVYNNNIGKLIKLIQGKAIIKADKIYDYDYARNKSQLVHRFLLVPNFNNTSNCSFSLDVVHVIVFANINRRWMLDNILRPYDNPCLVPMIIKDDEGR